VRDKEPEVTSPARSEWRVFFVALFAAFTAYLSTPLVAQTVVLDVGGALSVEATDTTLGEVLQAFNTVQPFEKFRLAPEIESRRVTLSLKNQDARAVLVAILKAAEVDYVLVGSSRLLVKDAGGALAIATFTVPETERQVTNAVAVGGQPFEQNTLATDNPNNDAVMAERSVQQFEQALTAPPVPRSPGSLVALPFPDVNGLPLTTVIPYQPVHQPLPFPATVLTPR
jgi:hypothetical protein